MSEDSQTDMGTLPTKVLVALVLVVGILLLGYLTGTAWLLAVATVVQEGGAMLAVLVAAGGFGYLVIRKLAPRSAPAGLRIVTACGLGLWMLSTAVLAVGSATTGLLKPWLWWPLIGGGLILAAWQGKKALEAWRPAKHTDGRGLMWIVMAAIAAIWLAGALCPPGLARTTDSYDVLEYHLQVPREFHENQHIGALDHNVYSFYPLGLEMLYLLAMALRGGAYEGVYLAKLMHGAFGLLTVAALVLSLKRDDEARGRFSAILLASSPILIYLSWMAMVELSEIFYLTVALLWLRRWLRDYDWPAAICLGLMLGASCAMKYLSVGLIVLPVGVVMLAACVRRPGRLAQPVAALGLAVLLFSPWLVRNVALTGNPVFPLVTEQLGRGHWSEESERRWIDGHGSRAKPPVPAPEGYELPPQPSRVQRLWYGLLTNPWMGTITLVLAALGVCAMAASRDAPDPWDWSLLAVLLLQVAVWAVRARGMPERFIVVALVPLALLAGGALSRLMRVKTNPFRRGASPPPRGPWGLVPAVGLCVASVLVNLLYVHGVARQHLPSGIQGQPIPQGGWDLPEDSRIMLVGEAKGFYFPPGTVYATVFDSHPLADLLASDRPAAEILDELRRQGITRIWVDWSEMLRLAATYGFPAALTSDLPERAPLRPNGWLAVGAIGPGPVGTVAFDRLGLVVDEHLLGPATKPAIAPAAGERMPWPRITIYRVPPAPKP